MTTGMVTNIQRYSVNDGYGIRTIVFLAGCSMRCAWCQNPETLGTGRPVVMFARSSCTGCGACVAACPEGAVHAGPKGLVFEREKCASCFKCVAECYFGARKSSAEPMPVARVFEEVMKDAAFFRNSGGGLTVSGGEPLLQPEFCRELLRRTREAGLHNAVETAGNVPLEALKRVLEFVDLFLYDIKGMDEATHRKTTGVSNRTILDNLSWLAASGIETIVRVPLIPGVNDGDEFEAIVDFVLRHPGVREMHILPYHDLGVSKYDQLDMAYADRDMAEDNGDMVERATEYAKRSGLRVSVGGGGFARQRYGEPVHGSSIA